jgi:ferredoxin
MSTTLRVDWPRCQGHRLCHELLPELIALDEWGFPIVTGEVPDDLVELAKQAVNVCPTIALRLQRR